MKMINIRISLFLFSICILSGCRWNDSNLGQNYYYLNEYNAVDWGFPGGAIIYKSEEENVYQDIKIPGNVVKVNFDKDFIIAKRIAKDNIKDTSYFIIIKKTDTVLGPLNLQSFRLKENELKIELKL
jgi:hypothetical protein